MNTETSVPMKRGRVARALVRTFSDKDDIIRKFVKSKAHTQIHRSMLNRHEILCHRVRNAKVNLKQGYITPEFYKKAVERVERVQERLLDAGVPAEVINAHHGVHSSW